jgi:tetratricopeptide (TPR) repeat protein
MVAMGKIFITVIVFLITFSANAQEEQTILLKGNELYKQRQYDAASEEYKKATAVNAKSSKAQYNYGVTLYRTKKLEDAEKAFNTAADNSLKPIDKSKYNYNKGVSLTRQKKLPESIDAYKQALRLNPTDQIARENLQKALNELKKQNQSQSQNNNNKQDDKKQPQEEKNESKMNKKEVEDKLDMLRREEKRLQQSVNKKNNPGTNNPMDW